MGCNCGGGSKFTNQVRRPSGNPPISGTQNRSVQSADARMATAKGGAVYSSKVLRKTV